VPAPGAESSLRVLRTALRNRSLRRALLAFLLFNTQEYAVWVAVAVYAFQQGGAGEAGAVLVLQLVPAALVAPVAAVLADRIPRSRALVLGYGLQACTTTLLGLSLVWAPAPVAYAAAAVAACCITLTRPAHNAVLPRLADTPGELTAANAASSTMDGLGTLIGPLVGGVIMAWSGPGGAVLAMAVVSAASALVALGIRVAHDEAVDPDEHVATFVAEALGGLRQARAEPDVAILLAVGGAQFVMVGMLDVFFALLAIDRLRPRAAPRRGRRGGARGRAALGARGAGGAARLGSLARGARARVVGAPRGARARALRGHDRLVRGLEPHPAAATGR
jgi:MFS family permease